MTVTFATSSQISQRKSVNADPVRSGHGSTPLALHSNARRAHLPPEYWAGRSTSPSSHAVLGVLGHEGARTGLTSSWQVLPACTAYMSGAQARAGQSLLFPASSRDPDKPRCCTRNCLLWLLGLSAVLQTCGSEVAQVNGVSYTRCFFSYPSATRLTCSPP